MRTPIKTLSMVALALMAVPAMTFAQKTKDEKIKEEKGSQQIVITRTGDKNEKMVVEIEGDKIKINGKDVKEYKDAEVSVNTWTGKGLTFQSGRTNWAFSTDDDEAVSLTSEDANRAMLGVNTEDDEKGAKIYSVTKESGADKAGLKKGDIITKINTTGVEDANGVTKIIRALKPGDKVAVDVIRDGKHQILSAELTKWKGVKMNEVTVKGYQRPSVRTSPSVPSQDYNSNLFERQSELFHDQANAYRGFQGTIGFTNTGKPRLGLSIQDTEDGKGAKITDVEDDGAAAKAGLKNDDVIMSIDDVEVKGTDDITKTIKNAPKDQYTFKLKITRDGKSQNVDLKLPRKLKTADL